MDSNFISRWFHLGFTRKQWEMYRSTQGHLEALAKNNIEIVRPASFFSAFLAIAFSTSRTVVFHHAITNTITFFIAAVLFFLLGFLSMHPKVEKHPVKTSWGLTFTFCLIWYALTIHYDTFTQQQTASVLTCLAFALLPIMFDANPRNNVIAAVVAWVVFAVLQAVLVPTYLMPLNLVDSAIAMLIGLCLGQKRTSAHAARHLYVNMYRTAANASTLVVQIDLQADKFEALQIPAYITKEAPTYIPASRAIAIMTRDFIAPQSKDAYASMMDFDNLAHAFDDPEVTELTLVFQSFRDKWFQMVVKEQARYKNKIGRASCRERV